MKDERLLITWEWFRAKWCSDSYECGDGTFLCGLRTPEVLCRQLGCPEWKALKKENKEWLSDTKEIENISTWARYTVQRLSKDEKFYGSIHYSIAGNTTLCNQHVDEKWYIKTTDFKGLATCKKCIKIQEEASNNG